MKAALLLGSCLLVLLCTISSAQQIRETPSKYPPIYVIDGIVFPGKDINHTDSTLTIHNSQRLRVIRLSSLQSVHVLKDREATKMYGQQGAHGAIQISTKKVR